jgi:hypothetical protein
MRVGMAAVDGCGGDDYGGDAEMSGGGGGAAAAARRMWAELETLRIKMLQPALDTTMQTRIQQCKYWKEKMQRLKLFLGKDLILIFFGFFMDSRYEDAIWTTKTVNLTDQPEIWYHLIG